MNWNPLFYLTLTKKAIKRSEKRASNNLLLARF